MNAATKDTSRTRQPSIQVRVRDQIKSGGSVEQAFDPCSANIINVASSDIACRSLTSHSIKSILTSSINIPKLKSSRATVHATSAIPVISCSIYNCNSRRPSPCKADGFPVQNNSISCLTFSKFRV